MGGKGGGSNGGTHDSGNKEYHKPHHPKQGGRGAHPRSRHRLPLLSSLAAYRLKAVVCHRGSTPFMGHYVAHICTSSPLSQQQQGIPSAGASAGAAGGEDGMCGQQWWRCDDNDVTPVEPAAVGKEGGEHGYLLFLEAC
jgi:hypothetical protein